MGDPIEKQAAIVAGITQGQVKWTVEHRAALQAVMDKREDADFPAHIWRDLHKMLAVLVTMLPDYKRGKEKES